jgi:hypothetical protein
MQGLGAFARYSPRVGNRELPITMVWGGFVAGVIYRGLLPCRDDDVFGAGVAWAQLDRHGALTLLPATARHGRHQRRTGLAQR